MISPFVSERVEEDVVTIPYTVTFIPGAGGAKKAPKPVGAARVTKLSSELPWMDFFGQMKILASKTLFPRKAVVDDADISLTFNIPRRVADTVLSNEEEYDFMLTSAFKMKEPGVKITITSEL